MLARSNASILLFYGLIKESVTLVTVFMVAMVTVFVVTMVTIHAGPVFPLKKYYNICMHVFCALTHCC